MNECTDEDLFFKGAKSETTTTNKRDEETIKQHILNMLKEQCKEQQLKEIADNLKQFYEHKKRHSYSQISSTIYHNIDNILLQNETALEDLKNNCDEVCRIGTSGEVSEDVKKGFAKFNDHVKLEITRISDQLRRNKQFDSMLKITKKEAIETNEKELKKSLRQIKSTSGNVIKKMNKINDNIFAQIVSILGIFSAIIFVFFGGTQLFSNALTGIHELDKQDVGILGFVISLIGLIMFDIIFMLLYVISVICGKPLSSDKGTHTQCYLKKIYEKFPFLIWMNGLLLCFAIISIIYFLKNW